MVSSPQDHLDYDSEGEAPHWPAQVEEDERQCPDVVETQGRFLETGPPTPVFVTATDPWHVVDLYHALVRLHGQQSPRRELYGDDADESPLGHTPPETRARYSSAEDESRRLHIKNLAIASPDIMKVSDTYKVVQRNPESNLRPNSCSQWAVLNPELKAEVLNSPYYIADDGWTMVLGTRPRQSPICSSTHTPIDTGGVVNNSFARQVDDEGYHSRPNSLVAAIPLKRRQHEQVVVTQETPVA
ncbi:hypothetical protein HBH98_252030 [Parastagonospora nodorum]|nr:hypothetical protein HBH53_018170 [Parastagonospora nodorum]KAH3956320.1 hypothetical protein HBH51_245170 [Parastagonospora nodorum]KAH4215508.1 hypothetical protein HBI06_248600 [Parastagonospora nodorum]KAH4223062.1 hypothetical protein HBI05_251360 [Parastagonospora nodorum]KAH4332793.1 hypothetical protein HBH98_252030 [Parastagonospora nodorum]